MEFDFFLGMHGLTIESMKSMVSVGRGVGKLQLFRTGGRWVLVFRPPGRQLGKSFYLMAEKSRAPRLFANSDTALKIASTMSIPGLWVSFIGL